MKKSLSVLPTFLLMLSFFTLANNAFAMIDWSKRNTAAEKAYHAVQREGRIPAPRGYVGRTFDTNKDGYIDGGESEAIKAHLDAHNYSMSAGDGEGKGWF